MKKSILLVEDNSDDEALALRAFKRNNVGNKVVVAHDGTEALDYLFASGAYAGRDISMQPELVVLDLKLPRIDGFEVLRQMRADVRTKLLPVVILSSSSEERDLARCYALGANSYIQKPIDFNEFLLAIQQVGLYWLAVNHCAPPLRAN